MSLELSLSFSEVDPARRHTRFLDGKQELRVDIGEQDAQHPRVLRLVFETGRIGPHALSVDVATELRRVRPEVAAADSESRSWQPAPGELTWDAVIPAGARSVTIRWLEPIEGARIVRLGEARTTPQLADAPGQITDLWHDADEQTDLKAYRKAKAAIEAVPACSERQKRQKCAALFWLSLDLCTALLDPAKEGPDVARELGIAEELVVVDPANRKWLSGVLMQRWMTRANCSAAGVPFGLVFYEIPGDSLKLAAEVSDLFEALLELAFPVLDAESSEALVQFACGHLRRPGVGPRLNVEPNSMAMASFAEVMELASVTDGNTPQNILDARDRLRRLFISMIEPFIEIYAPKPPWPGDHLESAYKFNNLGLQRAGDVGAAWTSERLAEHVALIAQLPVAELEARWGATLARGLRDERSVTKARRWASDHPAPHDGEARQEARTLIERELESEAEADD